MALIVVSGSCDSQLRRMDSVSRAQRRSLGSSAIRANSSIVPLHDCGPTPLSGLHMEITDSETGNGLPMTALGLSTNGSAMPPTGSKALGSSCFAGVERAKGSESIPVNCGARDFAECSTATGLLAVEGDSATVNGVSAIGSTEYDPRPVTTSVSRHRAKPITAKAIAPPTAKPTSSRTLVRSKVGRNIGNGLVDGRRFVVDRESRIGPRTLRIKDSSLRIPEQ